MTLSNNKLILIFGFNEDEKKELDTIIAINELPQYRVIEENMARMDIQSIVKGIKIPIQSTIKEKEKIILFNNLSDVELEKSITVFREKFGNVIFAVTTPTSIKWTFEKLLDNLIQEKRWAQKYNIKDKYIEEQK